MRVEGEVGEQARSGGIVPSRRPEVAHDGVDRLIAELLGPSKAWPAKRESVDQGIEQELEHLCPNDRIAGQNAAMEIVLDCAIDASHAPTFPAGRSKFDTGRNRSSMCARS